MNNAHASRGRVRSLLEAYFASVGKPMLRHTSRRAMFRQLCDHLGIPHATFAKVSMRQKCMMLTEWFMNGDETATSLLRCLDVARSQTDPRLAPAIEHATRMRKAAEEMRMSSVLTGISLASGVGFYESEEWKQLRYSILERDGNFCACCGRGPKQRVCLHVDHIKPRSLFPELALSPNNLQVLCEDCNKAKSNRSFTDWRAAKP